MADEMAEIDEVATIEAIQEETDQAVADAESDDEIVVSIGEEAPASEEAQEQPAPEWVKDLRKSSREKDKLLREREKEIKELKAKAGMLPNTAPVVVGPEPSFEAPTSNPDDAYDADVFKREWKAWNERKAKYDAEQAKARDAEDQQKREWQTKLDAYNDAKGKLKVKDYEDAELVAQETLNVTQQGIILHGSDNPALLTYALGKNPAKAKELAAINDPVKFAFAVAKLEKDLKVSNRKAPPPERTVSGSGSISGAVTGSTLDRLKAEAQRTGDYSAYMAAKRKSQTK